jgi:hypothetical protein
MKIGITGVAGPNGQSAKITLYNIIKRFEEDLKSHIPKLQEFNLILEKRTLSLPGNCCGNMQCIHTLCIEEKFLKLCLYYRNEPSCETIEKELVLQLKYLLKTY